MEAIPVEAVVHFPSRISDGDGRWWTLLFVVVVIIVVWGSGHCGIAFVRSTCVGIGTEALLFLFAYNYFDLLAYLDVAPADYTVDAAPADYNLAATAKALL
eukprot:3458586-Ditylum_brightwellii.AAC.1